MFIARILTALVGAAHLYFGYLEITDWEVFASRVLELDKNDPFIASTTSMAINQGTYNLFIGCGLLLAATKQFRKSSCLVALYLLGCVFIAGVVGWLTMGMTVFLLVQSIPAWLAFTACWVFWHQTID